MIFAADPFARLERRATRCSPGPEYMAKKEEKLYSDYLQISYPEDIVLFRSKPNLEWRFSEQTIINRRTHQAASGTIKQERK